MIILLMVFSVILLILIKDNRKVEENKYDLIDDANKIVCEYAKEITKWNDEHLIRNEKL